MKVCSLERLNIQRCARKHAGSQGRQPRRGGRPPQGRWQPLRAAVDNKPIALVSKPAGEWFFTESGQKGWVRPAHTPYRDIFPPCSTVLRVQVEAMELDTLTPDMPELLKEMGISCAP